MTTPNLPLSVDVEAMQRAEPIFQTALTDVHTVLQDMTTQQDTLAANWAGETASAFGQALTNWLNDMTAIQNALINLIDTMGQNTGVYANTQNESAQVQQAFTNQVNSLNSLSGLNF